MRSPDRHGGRSSPGRAGADVAVRPPWGPGADASGRRDRAFAPGLESRDRAWVAARDVHGRGTPLLSGHGARGRALAAPRRTGHGRRGTQGPVRPRPPEGALTSTHGPSFPSRHTAMALLAVRLMSGRRTRRYDGLAAAVAVSRVVLRAHWPTDVIGGWAFDTAWLALARAATSRARTQPYG
ncbi:phosphatase PAP2 family protein [Streptomyces sp. NPDC058653]|uniref:phosphatase PAP2 family protein n=1 Tax=Streptomyces sp. NPDC058653 TaxID=3346576 RepID=UPI0036485644